jgi:hypothetical protein
MTIAEVDPLPKMPSNIDAERAVLGAVLVDDGTLGNLVGSLRPQNFFYKHHQLIYEAMLSMGIARQAIDLVTLTEILYRKDELEAAGGAAYLAQLFDGVPRISNVEYYARIVKEKWLLRNLAHVGDDITRAALHPGAEAARIVNRLERISAQIRDQVWAEKKLRFRTGAEIAAENPNTVTWLAEPWVAAGSITELTGKIKLAGKTTFATHMSRAVLEGTEFLGKPTTKGPVLYLTEQTPASFREAMARAGLLGRKDFNVLFWADTLEMAWPDVARAAQDECKRCGARLMVVDTLPQFSGLVGEEENTAGSALQAMRPLQQAAGQGIGVLVVRHDRKAGGEVGDSARGSSASGGAVDSLISLRRPEGNVRRALRIIRGVSRFGGVPDQLMVELGADGYVALGDATDVAAQEAERVILTAAPDSEAEALTLDEMINGTGVKRSSGQRAIENLVKTGRLSRAGKGKKLDPYRFFKPEIQSAQTTISDGQEIAVSNSDSVASVLPESVEVRR